MSILFSRSSCLIYLSRNIESSRFRPKLRKVCTVQTHHHGPSSPPLSSSFLSPRTAPRVSACSTASIAPSGSTPVTPLWHTIARSGQHRTLTTIDFIRTASSVPTDLLRELLQGVLDVIITTWALRRLPVFFRCPLRFDPAPNTSPATFSSAWFLVRTRCSNGLPRQFRYDWLVRLCASPWQWLRLLRLTGSWLVIAWICWRRWRATSSFRYFVLPEFFRCRFSHALWCLRRRFRL